MTITSGLLTIIQSKEQEEDNIIDENINYFFETLYNYVIGKKTFSKRDSHVLKLTNQTQIIFLNSFSCEQYYNEDYNFNYKSPFIISIKTFGDEKTFIGYRLSSYTNNNQENELIKSYIIDKNNIDETETKNYIWTLHDIPVIMLYKMKYGEKTTNFKVLFNSFIFTELDVSILLYHVFFRC